jgi:subtilisin-like proprotein convertase family protein
MLSFDAAGLRTGTLVDMTVDAARNALTPNAYTYGALVAHGLQGMSLWSRGDTAWSKLAGVTPSGAGLWTGEHVSTLSNLSYLGISNNGLMTIWFEGEVWLDAGSTETFLINGDDFTFVEIAQPGSTSYTLLTDQNTTVSVPAPVSGWYPIHLGNGNSSGSSDLQFLHRDSASTPDPVPWTRDRLRARTSELSGVLRTVYGHQILGGGQAVSGSPPPIGHFEQNSLLVDTTFSSAPQGADSDNNDWSARYVGQVHIDQMGTYTLTIHSDDGNRGRLGSSRDQMIWMRDFGVGQNDVVTTVLATLVPGWNDLGIDYNQVNGGRDLRVQLQGPDFPTAIEVPRDRLRSVEAADDRIALGMDDSVHTVQDGGGAGNPGTATLTVAAFASAQLGTETVSSIDVTYQINSVHWEQLKVDLQAPGGAPVLIRDHVGPPGNLQGRVIAAQTLTAADLGALFGAAANGDWKLHVYDDVGGGGNSALESVRLTLHTTGGPDKVAKAASWTSRVIDTTTPVTAISGITWTERIPTGASVQVQFRACQQVDCSDSPAWSNPLTSGAPFTIAPARYLQLRVEMTSDGNHEPELQSLAIRFQRAAG